MKKGTILFCASKQNWPRYIIYNGCKKYSLGVYVNSKGEYEIYPERYSAQELSDEERYVPVGNVNLKNVISDAIERAVLADYTQKDFELYQIIKNALAHMWFAYGNKDGDCPHEFEKDAAKEAQEILGPWEKCMQKYFGNGGTKMTP